MTGKMEACLTAQVIYEFFAVITNPNRVEAPMTAEKAAEVCMDFWECRAIEKISPTPNATIDVLKTTTQMKLAKGKIFDCVMAITARDNKVECICTENVADFKRYRFLKATNPFA